MVKFLKNVLLKNKETFWVYARYYFIEKYTVKNKKEKNVFLKNGAQTGATCRY